MDDIWINPILTISSCLGLNLCLDYFVFIFIRCSFIACAVSLDAGCDSGCGCRTAAQLQHQNNRNCLGLAAASGQLPQLGVAAAAVDASPVHLLHATKQTR